MIKNFFLIALRNLQRNKGYSSINIAGLAVGMSVTILIGMWMFDEVSFNNYHTNHDDIAQVYTNQTSNGEVTTERSAPIPLGHELKTTYKSDFKYVVNAWWESDHTLTIGDLKTSQNGSFMDKEALEMFSFRMLRGSTASLNDPSSIVLSQSTATALFGDGDPINKSLRLDNLFDLKVTGVYEDLPSNSRFHRLKFVSSWDFWLSSNKWMKQDEDNWNKTISIFVQLQPNTTFESVSEKIKDAKISRIEDEQALRENPHLFLEPMNRWHLYSEWKDGRSAGGRIQFVWLFGIIGSFVLFLACINFMNLSTAQSERRAREVGIRKSIGSARSQLIQQFLSESFVVVTCSFIIALVFVTTSLPFFNHLTEKQMDWPWSNFYFWAASIVFIIVTSLLSGSYPAIYLSSFQPVKVLKGTFKAGRFSATPRKVLVIIQFTVSITLIIGTMIVWQQVQHAKNRPIGYTQEGLIMIKKNATDLYGKVDLIGTELKASGAVVDFAESSNPATEIWFTNSGFNWRGKDPNMHEDFATMAVTHDYGKTVSWDFVQGRDFSREHAMDSSGIVLNETAARFMGLDDPINEEITWKNKKYKVIGVIKDMVMTSPFEPVKQTIFYLSYSEAYMVTLRINPSMSASTAIQKIEKVFQTLMPALPLDYQFVDQQFALKYAGEERIGKLASIFAILAIFISCMGLFGMASFVAEQRRKEIGIRKVLGASVSNLWKMLSIEFLVLVAIACAIGIPVSWHFLERWLQRYTYRIDISIWVFVIASAGALFITLLTVSYQTIRASLSDPVKSLRSE